MKSILGGLRQCCKYGVQCSTRVAALSLSKGLSLRASVAGIVSGLYLSLSLRCAVGSGSRVCIDLG